MRQKSVTIYRNGIVNFRNTYTWADENPRDCPQDRTNILFHLMCGAVFLVIISQARFSYHQGLMEDNTYIFCKRLMELLEDIPLADRVQTWFLNDGASTHYCHDLMNHSNNTFGKLWIGRSGPVKWTPRSPGLTPADFFFWGWMRSFIPLILAHKKN